MGLKFNLTILILISKIVKIHELSFSVPLKEGVNDDYADAMRVDSGHDCYHVYKKKCPISFLALLLHLKN